MNIVEKTISKICPRWLSAANTEILIIFLGFLVPLAASIPAWVYFGIDDVIGNMVLSILLGALGLVVFYAAITLLFFVNVYEKNSISKLNARVALLGGKEGVIYSVLNRVFVKWKREDFTLLKAANERLKMNDEVFAKTLVMDYTKNAKIPIPLIWDDKNEAPLRYKKEALNLKRWNKMDLNLSGRAGFSCIFLSVFARKVKEGVMSENDFDATFKDLYVSIEESAIRKLKEKGQSCRNAAKEVRGFINKFTPPQQNLVTAAGKIPEKEPMKAFINAIEAQSGKLSPAVNTRLEEMVSTAAEGWERLDTGARAAFLATCNSVVQQVSEREVGIDETLNAEVVLRSKVLDALLHEKPAQ
jgi:hypothetical protein